MNIIWGPSKHTSLYGNQVEFDPEDEIFPDLFDTALKLSALPVNGPIIERRAAWLIESLIFIRQFQLTADGGYPEMAVWLNSPGGSVPDALAASYLIQGMPSPPGVVALGRCYSSALLILAAGRKGARRALPGTRFLIHDASCQAPEGPPRQQMADARENLVVDALYAHRLQELTRMTEEQIRRWSAEQHYFGPEEALELGLIDSIGLP